MSHNRLSCWLGRHRWMKRVTGPPLTVVGRFCLVCLKHDRALRRWEGRGE